MLVAASFAFIPSVLAAAIYRNSTSDSYSLEPWFVFSTVNTILFWGFFMINMNMVPSKMIILRQIILIRLSKLPSFVKSLRLSEDQLYLECVFLLKGSPKSLLRTASILNGGPPDLRPDPVI